MGKQHPLDNDPDFLADIASDMRKKDIMEKWSCSSGFVVNRRKKLGLIDEARAKKLAPSGDRVSGNVTVDADGGEFSELQTAERITDWARIFEHFDLDPESFEIIDDTVRMSMWQQSARAASGDRDIVNLYSYRAAFRRIKHEEEAEFASIIERIKGAVAAEPRKVALRTDGAFTQVVVPADLQAGKTDWLGGSEELTAQALASFQRAAEFAREHKPAEICILDPGDAIENMFNTPSQPATNDLSIDRQVELVLHIFLTGIEMLAPLAPIVRFAAVSSNHGAVRSSLKNQAADAHADYGLAIARMMRRALELNQEAFGHVTVQTPEPFMESLSLETSGTTIGLVHGHQASGPDKIGEWWKGQSLGGMPTADARILVAGHWHSTRYYQVGDSRHVFVSPSSDRGSSWFTNLKGDSSTSGMLMFTTRDGEWDHLRVI
ncbi:MAG: hypothetical protein ACTH32_06365 [Microbacterium gubbeenense]|uniref:hypothetical protein n=1 Tax=Microbacterium gubbeenense TaxID=159896 RepID=UPI003F959B19